MQFTFDVQWGLVVSGLLAVVLPALVGLVTTRVTDPGHKAVLLAVLSAVNGLLAELLLTIQNEGTFNVSTALGAALLSFVTSVAIHYGFLKPQGISDKLADTGRTSGAARH